MTDELPPPDLTERLSKRILAIHGGTGDPWRDHWNLTESDSILHKDALAAISARATLERDAARLDWLIDNCPYFVRNNGHQLPENSRAAIDLAISQDARKP